MTPDQFTSWLMIEGWHFVMSSLVDLGWVGIQNDTTKECLLLLADGGVIRGNYVPSARVVDGSMMPPVACGYHRKDNL